MGQAQLLLIVLGVVLVGIAIIAGIQAYSQNNRKASVDALTHDAVRMASDLQLWAQKPAQFGGPTTYGDIGAATHAKVGYDKPQVNSNGQCGFKTITAGTAGPVVITCNNLILGTEVVVTVTGITDALIAVTSSALSGVTTAPTYVG